jgi:LacI family transcriptional regulator
VTDRPAAPTLYDVAREAGVSLATASRALNGSMRRVREESRVRVVAAAERLGYTTNAPAQAFARGRATSLFLVVSDITDPFFAAIAAGVIRAADADGRLVNIGVTDRDPDRELRLVRMARQQRPAALVLAGSRRHPDRTRGALLDELRAFEDGGGRVVAIGQDSLPVARVSFDHVASGRELAGALAAAGYRRPVVLAGPDSLQIARERVRGLGEGFAAAGVELPASRLLASGFGRDDGERVVRERATALDADVLVAVNDVMAIGALQALRDAGVDVPGRIGVAGFDDVAPSRDAAPALSTVRLPLVEAGERAVELALGERASTDGGAPAAPRVRLATEVVLRASTRS